MNKLKPIFVLQEIVLNIQNNTLTLEKIDSLRADRGYAKIFDFVDPDLQLGENDESEIKVTTKIAIYVAKDKILTEEIFVGVEGRYVLSEAVMAAFCDKYYRLLRRRKRLIIDNFMFLKGKNNSIELCRLCAYSQNGGIGSYYRPIIEIYKEDNNFIDKYSRLILPLIE